MSLSFEFDEINRRAAADPRGFLAECDAQLCKRLSMASAQIADRAADRPIVLLAGPSGSGKTTSAGKLAEGLELIGIGAHVISMDDYYLTVTEETHRRDAKGNLDYETPDILDLPLMRKHFAELAEGREVLVPRFDFTKQARSDASHPLRLKRGEVAIFEGIHALNPALLDGGAHAARVYVSARSNIRRDGGIYFKGTWLRLVRRAIRDANFRGADAGYTFSLWAGVRRGEKKYISPYKDLADIIIDTALNCEVCALRDTALPLLRDVPDVERGAEIREIAPKLEQFTPIPLAYLSKQSLLREFVG